METVGFVICIMIILLILYFKVKRYEKEISNLEKRAKEIKRRKGLVLENLPIIIYSCDYDKSWTMKYLSDGCYKLTGYYSEQFLDNNELEFKSIIVDKYVDYLDAKWEEAIKTKGVLREEYEIITVSGEKKWVWENGQAKYDSIKKNEFKLKYLTEHNYLTGVSNLVNFEQFYNKEKLSEKTKDELIHFDSSIKGDIYIGTGESSSISKIIKICHSLQKENPDIHFHFTSGDSLDLLDRLDNGLFDFCVVYGDVDQAKYNYIKLPYKEIRSFLLNKDDPLSAKEYITRDDINNCPLILSRQSLNSESIFRWFNKKPSELLINNTYSLINNAVYMAEQKMGYLLTLKDIIDVSNKNLIYKTLKPELSIEINIIWQKFKILSKPAEKFLKLLKEAI